MSGETERARAVIPVLVEFGTPDRLWGKGTVDVLEDGSLALVISNRLDVEENWSIPLPESGYSRANHQERLNGRELVDERGMPLSPSQALARTDVLQDRIISLQAYEKSSKGEALLPFQKPLELPPEKPEQKQNGQVSVEHDSESDEEEDETPTPHLTDSQERRTFPFRYPFLKFRRKGKTRFAFHLKVPHEEAGVRAKERPEKVGIFKKRPANTRVGDYSGRSAKILREVANGMKKRPDQPLDEITGQQYLKEELVELEEIMAFFITFEGDTPVGRVEDNRSIFGFNERHQRFLHLLERPFQFEEFLTTEGLSAEALVAGYHSLTPGDEIHPTIIPFVFSDHYPSWATITLVRTTREYIDSLLTSLKALGLGEGKPIYNKSGFTFCCGKSYEQDTGPFCPHCGLGESPIVIDSPTVIVRNQTETITPKDRGLFWPGKKSNKEATRVSVFDSLKRDPLNQELKIREFPDHNLSVFQLPQSILSNLERRPSCENCGGTSLVCVRCNSYGPRVKYPFGPPIAERVNKIRVRGLHPIATFTFSLLTEDDLPKLETIKAEGQVAQVEQPVLQPTAA